MYFNGRKIKRLYRHIIQVEKNKIFDGEGGICVVPEQKKGERKNHLCRVGGML